MSNGRTTKMFRNIDKQDEIIASIALVSISFSSQLVIKQTSNEKQNLREEKTTNKLRCTTSLQGVMCMFTCGYSNISTTDWHATPIITD